MLIGVLNEIKDHEYFVGSVSSSVCELVQHGYKGIIFYRLTPLDSYSNYLVS
jgi:alanine dehydrogenase